MKLLNFNQFSLNESSSLSKFGLDRNAISNIHKGERLSHDAELEEISFEDLGNYSTNDLFGVTEEGDLILIKWKEKVDHIEGNRYFRIIKNRHERSVRYTRQHNKKKFDESTLIDHISENWDKYSKVLKIDLIDNEGDEEKEEKYYKLIEMVNEFFGNDEFRKEDTLNLLDNHMVDRSNTEFYIGDIIADCYYRFENEIGDSTTMSLDEASHKFLLYIKDNILDSIKDLRGED